MEREKSRKRRGGGKMEDREREFRHLLFYNLAVAFTAK